MALLTTPQTLIVESVSRVYGPLGSTEVWTDTGPVSGWLDLMTGTDQPSGGLDLALVEESTHVLITDGMQSTPMSDADRIRDAAGRRYWVTYVDDVTGVGDHQEVYLRYAK